VIRTNLSTRPFYNERTVHALLAVAAIVLAAATAFNVSRVLRYSRSDTQLATQASRDEARAVDLRRQALALRASVDAKQMDVASADAQQANELIDRRTFSWTELFNRFETTIPDDVRIAAVRPRVEKEKGFVLTIVVVARSVDDVEQFMENLQKTGAFTDTLSVEEHVDEQGQIQSTLQATYLPGATARTPPQRATRP
jgi:Tfp pilus assembly protein PilN